MKNRIEETRNVDMNAGIPRRVIQSSNNTIAVELINQRIDDLTQVSCTDQALSADLRTEFSELQERVNSSVSLWEQLLSVLWLDLQGWF